MNFSVSLGNMSLDYNGFDSMDIDDNIIMKKDENGPRRNPPRKARRSRKGRKRDRDEAFNNDEGRNSENGSGEDNSEDDDFIDPDNDLIKKIMNLEPINTESDKKDENLCNNPLCDHKEFTEEERRNRTDPPLVKVDSIDDLIELGKTYHCKKNTVYYGVNLRILCNLVQPLTKLKKMVGMKKVKENIVNQIIFFLQGFNKKDRCNNCLDCTYNLPCAKNLNNDMLHTVITGPPGVGKSELGKILGNVYKAMGILSNGDFHVASRADLIGKYLGHTADKTQKFIDKCKGGVMFIDEAYSLGHKEQRDSFSKECIDTINRNMTERRDFLVIIAGYKKELDKCFFSANPGLERRFSFRYDITGYTPEELMNILLLKIHDDGWTTEFDTGNKPLDQLKRFFARNKTSFPHYGGDVETLFLKCKIHHSNRVIFKNESIKKVLTMKDFENGFKTYIKDRKYKDKDEEENSMLWI